MCGRFSLYADPKLIIKQFNIGNVNQPIIPSYNIAPSQQISVVIQPEGFTERILTTMRWGLIPAWHTSSRKLQMNNCARLETADSKPTFKNSFFKKRCLIIADGFYEWNEQTKQPYYIQQSNKTTFGMAGIWERWIDGDNVVESCCILTQNPNAKIQIYHDRMPVIVPSENYSDWLMTKNQSALELKELLVPLTEENTTLHPVTKKMNTPKFNTEDCIFAISLD